MLMPAYNVCVEHSLLLFCSPKCLESVRSTGTWNYFIHILLKTVRYLLTKTFIQTLCLIFLKISGRDAALTGEPPLVSKA